jgi:hypothetical protein
MAFDPVLTGATANDGTGDPLRTAFTRINDNFDLAVEGPTGTVTADTVVLFDGTTGKLVQGGGKVNADLVTGPASSTDGTVVTFDGTTGKVVKASTKVTADIVTGPASATSGNVAAFDGTTGKVLQDTTKVVADIVTGPASATDNSVAVYDGTTGKLLKDGTGTVTAGKFSPTATTVAGNGVYLPATDAVAISTDGVERMRIDSSGNVGIGTTSPAASLDVAGTGALKTPVGTDAQRPTPATGMLRFNSDSAKFEGYDGSAWDAIAGLPTGGTTGQVLAKASGTDYDAAWSSTALVDGAARPLNTAGAFLDGTTGLIMSGVVNNFATIPDAAYLDPTSTFEVIAHVTPRSNTGFNWVFGTLSLGNQGPVQVLNSSGQWRVFAESTTDSTDQTNLGAVTLNTDVWIRVSFVRDNGSSQSQIDFFTGSDGVNWGTPVTRTFTEFVDIRPWTQNPRIGNGNGGNAGWNGDVYRLIYEVDGVVQLDVDFAAQTADALAFTESSTNAATVSINTTRYTVGIPNSGFVSVGTESVAANRDYFEPFTLTASTVVDLLTFEVTTAPASTATVHAAIYAATGDYQPTGAPLAVFGGVSVATSVAAVYSEQITPVTLPPGAYVLAFNSSLLFTARSMRRPAELIHTLGTNPILATTRKNRTNAAFPTPSAGWSERTTSTVGKNTFAVLRWRPA